LYGFFSSEFGLRIKNLKAIKQQSVEVIYFILKSILSALPFFLLLAPFSIVVHLGFMLREAVRTFYSDR
jgi:hypothetical protein